MQVRCRGPGLWAWAMHDTGKAAANIVTMKPIPRRFEFSCIIRVTPPKPSLMTLPYVLTTRSCSRVIASRDDRIGPLAMPECKMRARQPTRFCVDLAKVVVVLHCSLCRSSCRRIPMYRACDATPRQRRSQIRSDIAVNVAADSTARAIRSAGDIDVNS